MAITLMAFEDAVDYKEIVRKGEEEGVGMVKGHRITARQEQLAAEAAEMNRIHMAIDEQRAVNLLGQNVDEEDYDAAKLHQTSVGTAVRNSSLGEKEECCCWIVGSLVGVPVCGSGIVSGVADWCTT
uniref:Uncharacterized protein n=1 Tax=Parascaris equorum TaxID=6256 RepID=A0A914SEZ3_PAREQ